MGVFSLGGRCRHGHRYECTQASTVDSTAVPASATNTASATAAVLLAAAAAAF